MTTPTREQVPNNLAATVYVFRDKTTGAVYATYADGAPNALDDSGLEHIATLEPRAWIAAHFDDFTAGRDQGLREAKEVFSVSEHMHARNGGLMLCISDLSAVIVRMAAGIDHLSETARQWEPDHSSGADRRGWVLATEARDDALRLLKEHAAAIEQLRGK